jgi:hypothetical protein
LVSEVAQVRQTAPPLRKQGLGEGFDAANRASLLVGCDPFYRGLQNRRDRAIETLVSLPLDRDRDQSFAIPGFDGEVRVSWLTWQIVEPDLMLGKRTLNGEPPEIGVRPQ